MFLQGYNSTKNHTYSAHRKLKVIKPNEGLIKICPGWVWSAIQAQDTCTGNTQQGHHTQQYHNNLLSSVILTNISAGKWPPDPLNENLPLYAHLYFYLCCPLLHSPHPSSYCIVCILTNSCSRSVHLWKPLIFTSQSEIKDVAITAGYFIMPRKKRAAFPLSATNTLIQSEIPDSSLSSAQLGETHEKTIPNTKSSHKNGV